MFTIGRRLGWRYDPSIPDERLTIAVDLHGASRVLRLAGELDFDTAPGLKVNLLQHVAESDIIVDLSGLSFMDSTGIAVLVAAYKQAIKEGRTMTAFGAQDRVASTLRITGVDRLLGMVE